MAMKPYLNSKDFLVINPDGTSLDYNVMKEMNQESFKQMNLLNFKTVKEGFRFLSPNKVLLTWHGHNKFELNTGEKMKIDSYVGTMFFEKIYMKWFIVYAYESASPTQLQQ